MKEHPILFSTPMVQAILAGRKTQTRRVAKKLPTTDVIRMGLHLDGSQYLTGFNSTWRIECPHGKIGDRLWVRETFKIHISGVEYRADDGLRTSGKWKPSIFMPRDLSRITLEITGIRAERLNRISDLDSIAEGSLSFRSYADLWESINGEGSWDQNPWVWVIEFKVLDILSGRNPHRSRLSHRETKVNSDQCL